MSNAGHVMHVATGEIDDEKRDPAKEHMRRGGLAEGEARVKPGRKPKAVSA